MKKILLTITAILAIGISLNAQEFLEKSEVHGSFETDGMFYQADNALGITDSLINGKNFGFNAFADIIYTLGDFMAGFRYEAYAPPIAGFDPRLEGQGFPYLWATYATEKYSFTVGNFYEQFGNGMVLRTYQEWTLGYDNSINGVRIIAKPVKGVILKGVYGTQRFFWNKWEKNAHGIVKGVDAELNFNDLFASMAGSKLKLTLGGSAVSKYQVDDNPFYKMPQNVAAFAGRFNVGLGKFNFTSEYAYKINDPSAVNNYIYKDGQGLVCTGSYSTAGLGLFAMFKRYDNMSYKSDQSVTGNALHINYLPALTEDHIYMLASMYPYATQPNGEIGFQFQVNYKIPKDTRVGGKYGVGLSVNFSQINDINRQLANDSTVDNQGNPIYDMPGTIGYKSDFFTPGKVIFNRDLTVAINKKFSKKVKGIFTLINQEYNQAVVLGHTGEPNVKANIAIVDMTYKFTSNKALRGEFQGLWTKEDKQDWAAILLEYTISPHWFFSVSDQYNYGNEIKANRLHYYTGSFGYTYQTTRIAVTYGRQREGVVCVGGVCRQVPASNGFSITLSSNF